MKPEELWTAVDYWNDLQKGDLEVETYIRVGDELAEYAEQLEEENAALKRKIDEMRLGLKAIAGTPGYEIDCGWTAKDVAVALLTAEEQDDEDATN